MIKRATEKIRNINNSKIIRLMLYSLFMIQPIIELIKSLFGYKVEIMGISILELPNIALFVLLLIFTLINKNFRKEESLLLLFMIILITYLIFHCINILGYDNSVYKSNISIPKEIYNVIRVYAFPVLLVYILYKNVKANIFSIKDFTNCIIWVSLFICSIIVICNVFKISFISYNEHKEFIKGSIFEWWNYTGSYRELTSRGLFESSNRLSSVLIMTLSTTIFLAYKNNQIKYYFILLIQMLAMFMIGSRTTSLGSILVLIFIMILILFIKFFFNRKYKMSYYWIILLICLIPVFCTSPYIKRLKNDSVLKNDFSIELNEFKKVNPQYAAYIDNFDLLNCNEDELSKEELKKNIKFMDDFSYYSGIMDIFTEKYPFEKDYEFWCERTKESKLININSRVLKTKIFKRFLERDNRFSNSLFGVGSTFDFLSLERDYYDQYFRLGLFGVIIFLGPPIYIILISGLKVIKNFKKKFRLENIVFIFSGAIGCLFAYFGGHMYGILFTSIYLFAFSTIGYVYLKEESN